MVKASQTLKIPIYATTQNAARLGPTVHEIKDLLNPQSSSSSSTSNNRESPSYQEWDKTAFSMLIPTVKSALSSQSQSQSSKQLSIILVGIETHICVTQTTLDLLSLGHKVYILADGVSSCNALERPIALARLAKEGAIVTTSESILFELVGDAGSEYFKAVSGLVKETKEETKGAVETFCKL